MNKDRVMVVEDEASIRAVLREFLESRQYEVIEGSSCADAKRLWREAHPDIAILDYSLPDGNALDLLTALQAVDSSIPVIILTGYGSIELAVEAGKMGGEEVFTQAVGVLRVGLVFPRGP